jgi:hypothetical protein
MPRIHFDEEGYYCVDGRRCSKQPWFDPKNPVYVDGGGPLYQRKTYCLKNAIQVTEPSDLMNGSIKWLDPEAVKTKIIGSGCSQITAYSIRCLEGSCSSTNGWSRFWPGDWLIQFEDGSYSICAPVTFEQLYEEVP